MWTRFQIYFIVDRKWITERKKKRNDVVLHNTFTPLSFQPIMDDENNGDNDASDYSGDNDASDYSGDNVSHVQAATKPKKKSNVYINQNPERDTKRYHNAKTIPGNSTYGDIVKDGKKYVSFPTAYVNVLYCPSLTNI